ncbi:MAG: hypothetical protein ABH827_05875 [bacterium]
MKHQAKILNITKIFFMMLIACFITSSDLWATKKPNTLDDYLKTWNKPNDVYANNLNWENFKQYIKKHDELSKITFTKPSAEDTKLIAAVKKFYEDMSPGTWDETTKVFKSKAQDLVNKTASLILFKKKTNLLYGQQIGMGGTKTDTPTGALVDIFKEQKKPSEEVIKTTFDMITQLLIAFGGNKNPDTHGVRNDNEAKKLKDYINDTFLLKIEKLRTGTQIQEQKKLPKVGNFFDKAKFENYAATHALFQKELDDKYKNPADADRELVTATKTFLESMAPDKIGKTFEVAVIPLALLKTDHTSPLVGTPTDYDTGTLKKIFTEKKGPTPNVGTELLDIIKQTLEAFLAAIKDGIAPKKSLSTEIPLIIKTIQEIAEKNPQFKDEQERRAKEEKIKQENEEKQQLKQEQEKQQREQERLKKEKEEKEKQEREERERNKPKPGSLEEKIEQFKTSLTKLKKKLVLLAQNLAAVKTELSKKPIAEVLGARPTADKLFEALTQLQDTDTTGQDAIRTALFKLNPVNKINFFKKVAKDSGEELPTYKDKLGSLLIKADNNALSVFIESFKKNNLLTTDQKYKTHHVETDYRKAIMSLISNETGAKEKLTKDHIQLFQNLNPNLFEEEFKEKK